MEWDCGQGLVVIYSAAKDMTNATDVNGGFLTRAVLESEMAQPPRADRPLTIGKAFEQIRLRVWELNQQDPVNFRQVPILSSSHFPRLDTPLYF